MVVEIRYSEMVVSPTLRYAHTPALFCGDTSLLGGFSVINLLVGVVKINTANMEIII